MLRDEEEALDAMQDTFVKVLRYQDRLDASGPSSLLYTIATNVCLNRIRSRSRDRSTAIGDDLERIAGHDEHSERALAGHFLDRLFSGQRPDTRDIAVYHYLDGFTLEETAQLSGLSVSGVRKRLRRLRESGLALKES
jgi:RNA polymerase sigma-70 factor (ECF subfamily)